jgi:hypothetical protein
VLSDLRKHIGHHWRNEPITFSMWRHGSPGLIATAAGTLQLSVTSPGRGDGVRLGHGQAPVRDRKGLPHTAAKSASCLSPLGRGRNARCSPPIGGSWTCSSARVTAPADHSPMVLIASNGTQAGRFDDVSSPDLCGPVGELLGLAMARGWHESRADAL